MVHNINIANPSCTDAVCMLKKKTVNVNGKQIALYDLFKDVKINRDGYVDIQKA